MAKDLGMRIIQEAFAEYSHVTCEYCDVEVRLDVAPTHPQRATADHCTPKARGGGNSRHNIAIACCRCNHAKGPLTADEFLTLRDDPKKLAKVRAEWARRLQGDQQPKKPRLERKVEKRQRRMARLTERLRIPDPECLRCFGTGMVRQNPRLQQFCVCTLEPLDPERAAAHINGRRQDRPAWQPPLGSPMKGTR